MEIREGIYSFRKSSQISRYNTQKMYLDLNIASTGEWSLPSNNYGLKTSCKDTMLFNRLAQLVEHRTAVQEVAGSNLGRTNTHGL